MSPDTQMANETITNGELFRAVNLIRNDIKDVRADISAKPSVADITYLRAEVEELKEFRTWVMRLGIPGLIATVVSILGLLERVTGGIS